MEHSVAEWSGTGWKDLHWKQVQSQGSVGEVGSSGVGSGSAGDSMGACDAQQESMCSISGAAWV